MPGYDLESHVFMYLKFSMFQDCFYVVNCLKESSQNKVSVTKYLQYYEDHTSDLLSSNNILLKK